MYKLPELPIPGRSTVSVRRANDNCAPLVSPAMQTQCDLGQSPKSSCQCRSAFGARKLNKCLVFCLRYTQGHGQLLRQLLGRQKSARLDLAYGRQRAGCLSGQVFLGQIRIRRRCFSHGPNESGVLIAALPKLPQARMCAARTSPPHRIRYRVWFLPRY